MNRMASNPGLIFCIFLVLLIAKTSSWAPAQSPNSDPHLESSTQFFRISCQSTLYPDLCVSSLSRYAPSIHQNPVTLARIAAKLSLSQIHSTASLISRYDATNSSAAALKDCVHCLASAADQTKRSISEIGRLDRPGKVGTEVAWRVSNVQTWMSAALTNEETCMDGFETDRSKDDDGRVKDDVFRRVGRAKMYSSNALALVNCLVNGS